MTITAPPMTKASVGSQLAEEVEEAAHAGGVGHAADREPGAEHGARNERRKISANQAHDATPQGEARRPWRSRQP